MNEYMCTCELLLSTNYLFHNVWLKFGETKYINKYNFSNNVKVWTSNNSGGGGQAKIIRSV